MTPCPENEHVNANYACVACPAGSTRAAGDNPSLGATTCDVPEGDGTSGDGTSGDGTSGDGIDLNRSQQQSAAPALVRPTLVVVGALLAALF